MKIIVHSDPEKFVTKTTLNAVNKMLGDGETSIGRGGVRYTLSGAWGKDSEGNRHYEIEAKRKGEPTIYFEIKVAE